jgi:hypothetical protein
MCRRFSYETTQSRKKGEGECWCSRIASPYPRASVERRARVFIACRTLTFLQYNIYIYYSFSVSSSQEWSYGTVHMRSNTAPHSSLGRVRPIGLSSDTGKNYIPETVNKKYREDHTKDIKSTNDIKSTGQMPARPGCVRGASHFSLPAHQRALSFACYPTVETTAYCNVRFPTGSIGTKFLLRLQPECGGGGGKRGSRRGAGSLLRVARYASRRRRAVRVETTPRI